MEEMVEIINNILGKKITKAISGGGNGSILTLEFQDLEVVIFIYCAWRLQNEQEILTGSNESTIAITGEIPLNIKKLEEDMVTQIDTSRYFDLMFYFQSGKTLNVFCDITPAYPSEDYNENWSICFPRTDITYTLDKNFILQTGNYND